mgnify:CR=1 FL=1
MNVKIPIGLVLIIGLVAGYLLGTEQGRAHRDVVLVKLGRGGENLADAAADAAGDVADAAS